MSKTLITDILQGLRFTGTDQNPAGIRDIIFNLEKRLEDAEKVIETYIDKYFDCPERIQAGSRYLRESVDPLRAREYQKRWGLKS